MHLRFKLGGICVMLALLLGLTGCGVHTVRINAPDAESASDRLGQVFIRDVQDDRQFMAHASTPDIPSISPVPSISSGVPANGETLRSRVVGRMRDGYGKTQTNLFLADNQTVQDLIRQTLANALSSSGYIVVEAPVPEALILDVSIQHFWGWEDIQPKHTEGLGAMRQWRWVNWHLYNIPPGLVWGSGAIDMRASLRTHITIFAEEQPIHELVIPAESSLRSETTISSATRQTLYRMLMKNYFQNIYGENLLVQL